MAAIETGGSLTLARRHADDITGVDTLHARTVHAVLAHALGQSAEAVRREFGRYASGDRMCTAGKCVKLVEAASKLGWIAADARGTGAEEWVAWCRAEKERLERDKDERVVRGRMRRRGELADRVQELVSFAVASSAPGEVVDDVAALLAVVVEAATETLLRSERHWQPHAGALLIQTGSSIQGRFTSAAREIDGKYQRQCDYDRAAMAGIQEQMREEEDAFAGRERERWASGPVVLASKERPSELSERALGLGIGRDQLRRILACLETGEGLSAEDSKRRRELLDAYADPDQKWKRWSRRPPLVQADTAGPGRSWSDAKAGAAARSARASRRAGSVEGSTKRKAAGSKRERRGP